MKRRDFIKLAGVSGISAALLPIAPSVFGQQAIPSRSHSYRLTYKVDLPGEGKKARLWLPLPDTDDTPHQFSQGSVWSGNADIAKFDNVLNFRGEPYVPGIDALLQSPVTAS